MPLKPELEASCYVMDHIYANTITVHTSNLFDPKTTKFLKNHSIVVDSKSGLIKSLFKRPDSSVNLLKPGDADLRGKTVLPGLVDAHTHIFLHPYSDTPSINQERDESSIERVVRATNHARAALLAGYTTYRDLGTEGLYDADIGFRDSINRGIIPGPRLFVATEAIASSGGYVIRHESNLPGLGITVPRISDPADGVVGCRAAVRRRIGAGADIVKFYADYRKRARQFPAQAWPGCLPVQFPPASQDPIDDLRNPNITLFTQEGMDAMVAEARVSRAPIAAHAQGSEAVIMAARAGVTSIEHGFVPSNEALDAMEENGTIFVPTLSVIADAVPAGEVFHRILKHVKQAYHRGIKIAAGGDTGATPHGDNVRELELLVQAGLTVVDALQAATLHGWDACGGDLCGRKFGWWEDGVAADIVALDGNPVEDITALRRVNFVMKDGKIWKQDGKALGML